MKNKEKQPKKVLSILFSAVILSVSCVVYPSVSVKALTPENSIDEIAGNQFETVYDKNVTFGNLPDSKALEQMYIERLFYGSSISTYSDYGRQNLTGTQLYVYNILRTEIEKIAAGTRTSTEISVTLDEGVTDDLLQAVSTACDYLLVDMPEEFYWCDKTAGIGAGAGSYKGIYTSFYANFPVSSDYSAGGAFGTFTVDTLKIKKAQTSVKNAQAIAEKYSSLSDYEKVLAYKEEICSLTSYNWDAATTDLNKKPPYGDPWQLVWVFDNDPNTNVVCEGYSKAFQYLCDLGGIDCYTVTGYMGDGDHMWNIVKIDGKCYHVDITNCDSDAIGAPDYLFLKGAATSSSSGCCFKYNTYVQVPYTYDTETIAMYPASILTVSTADYSPSQLDPTHGDVNGDGKITATDLIFVRRYIVHINNDISLAADMNNDGKVTSADFILLRRLYMNMPSQN